jgi:hypothetical protein
MPGSCCRIAEARRAELTAPDSASSCLEHIPLTYTHTPHVQRNFHIVGD